MIHRRRWIGDRYRCMVEGKFGICRQEDSLHRSSPVCSLEQDWNTLIVKFPGIPYLHCINESNYGISYPEVSGQKSCLICSLEPNWFIPSGSFLIFIPFDRSTRARELKLWENVHPPQHVTCHVSCVTCHMSRVTCHVSHVMCHMSQ